MNLFPGLPGVPDNSGHPEFPGHEIFGYLGPVRLSRSRLLCNIAPQFLRVTLDAFTT